MSRLDLSKFSRVAFIPISSLLRRKRACAWVEASDWVLQHLTAFFCALCTCTYVLNLGSTHVHSYVYVARLYGFPCTLLFSTELFTSCVLPLVFSARLYIVNTQRRQFAVCRIGRLASPHIDFFFFFCHTRETSSVRYRGCIRERAGWENTKCMPEIQSSTSSFSNVRKRDEHVV